MTMLRNLGKPTTWLNLSLRERRKRALIQEAISMITLGLIALLVGEPLGWGIAIGFWLMLTVMNIGFVVRPERAIVWSVLTAFGLSLAGSIGAIIWIANAD